jgi:hypothetical protein
MVWTIIRNFFHTTEKRELPTHMQLFDTPLLPRPWNNPNCGSRCLTGAFLVYLHPPLSLNIGHTKYLAYQQVLCWDAATRISSIGTLHRMTSPQDQAPINTNNRIKLHLPPDAIMTRMGFRHSKEILPIGHKCKGDEGVKTH